MALCFAIVLAAYLGSTRISARDLTLTRMFVVHRRILMYCTQHDSPPSTLEDLSHLQNYDDHIVDAWDRKFEYHILDGSIAVLTSHGQNGFSDQSIVRRFALRDKDGHWNDPLSEWLPDISK